MACPYFEPGEPDAGGELNARPRPPLGRFYRGRCLAGGGEAHLPLERCNLGYARGLACFPTECAADANRFSVVADQGATVTVQWSVEGDHRPLSWGEANWRCDSGEFETASDDSVLGSQMMAYAASYLALRDRSSNG